MPLTRVLIKCNTCRKEALSMYAITDKLTTSPLYAR